MCICIYGQYQTSLAISIVSGIAINKRTHLNACWRNDPEGFTELLEDNDGRRIWRKLCKFKGRATLKAQASAILPAVVVSLRDAFFRFILKSVASMYRASRHQRFFPTLLAQYHGSSSI